MEIIKIVNQLKSCNYQCEAGPLEKNTAFIELETAAKKNGESEPSTSTNKAMDVINAFTKEYETTIFDDQLSSGFEQAAIIARKYYDKFKRLLTP